jgi:Fe-S cluster assembly protein SufB
MTDETSSKTISVDEALEKNEYKYGFTTDIETYTLPKGLSEDVVRAISMKKI